MRTPSSVLSFLALSVFILAGSAMANGYGQPQDHRPAYQKPTEGLDSGCCAKSCLGMQGIVQRAVKRAFTVDYTIAAGLIRLFFHDFAAGGCDASILINGKDTEKETEVSKMLRGFGLIESLKAELEEHCPRTVSCADILFDVLLYASSLTNISSSATR